MSFYYSCGPGGSRVLLTDGNKPVAADGCSLRSELGSGSASGTQDLQLCCSFGCNSYYLSTEQ